MKGLPHRARLAACLLVLGALAGCASAPPSSVADTATPTRVEESYLVQAHDFAELNLLMDAGATITFNWSVVEARPVRFDVHSHDGPRVVEHVAGENASMTGAFTAPGSGAYSLMWMNPGERDVRVAVVVEGAFRVKP